MTMSHFQVSYTNHNYQGMYAKFTHNLLGYVIDNNILEYFIPPLHTNPDMRREAPT